MSLRAIGSRVKIPYLHRIEYITGSDSKVTLKVNHSVYVGKYNSVEDAKEVVKGILTKLGCNRPDERILTIPTVGDTPAGPPSYDWSDMSATEFTISENNVLLMTTDLDVTVTVGTVTGDFAFYRVSNTAFSTSSYVTESFNWTTLTSPQTITAGPGQYVGFTKGFVSRAGTDTFTVTDNATATVIDTFTVTVDPGGPP